MGTEAPHPFIRRHFATIDGQRQIHYRRAGKGPPVLLLHQSPTSSREYVPLIEVLSPHFTVIAPDTPGNGLSEGLTLASPTMDDYGDNIAAFLSVIGVAKIAVYGFHTGASVAAAFATRHPARVHGAILNGFVALTSEERADILANYLTPIEPRWDGGHLVWLWARLREQSIFFPWYRASLAGRADRDLASPEAIHWQVMEWLRAGDAYRKPYGAAFKYPGDHVAMRLTTPTVICASDWDMLVTHLDRLPKNLPACVAIKRIGPDRAAVPSFVLNELKRFAKGEAPPAPRPQPLTGRTYQDYVDVPGGQLHVRRTDSGSGRVVLVQHDAASDNRIVDRATAGFMGKRPALAFDLPGNGESDNTIGTTAVTVPRYAEVVGQALDSLGLKEIDAYGMWGGGSVMLDLAIQRPKAIKHLAMSNVLFFEPVFAKELYEKYTFPIEPDWYGGHLLKCWHAMRDQGIYWPWYERTRKGIIWQEPFLDVNMVHNRVVGMLKAGTMYHHHYRADFAYPTGDALKKATVPTLVGSPRWDPNFVHSQRAHAAVPSTRWLELPPDMKDWPGAFLPFLNA
ncbi:MAG: alpha/beta hydrolase [Alphaproteobacteria bacterium]|nr:alpha/beta hydrolase [Alphaproteobacteria bacterium]